MTISNIINRLGLIGIESIDFNDFAVVYKQLDNYNIILVDDKGKTQLLKGSFWEVKLNKWFVFCFGSDINNEELVEVYIKNNFSNLLDTFIDNNELIEVYDLSQVGDSLYQVSNLYFKSANTKVIWAVHLSYFSFINYKGKVLIINKTYDYNRRDIDITTTCIGSMYHITVKSGKGRLLQEFTFNEELNLINY